MSLEDYEMGILFDRLLAGDESARQELLEMGLTLYQIEVGLAAGRIILAAEKGEECLSVRSA